MTAPPDVVIEDARRYANESPCQKSKRGAVVFSGTCTIAGGFNGPPVFGADIFQCDGSANCRRDCGKICEHAEARAIREATAITGRMGLTGFDLVHVRVCCGDWKRVLGRSTLGIDTDHGMTPCGVMLDPPYAHDLRDKRLYREDEPGISEAVREWAIANGDNPALRIALCGQEGEHVMPKSWSKIAWASTSSAASRSKERIWFSPFCNAALAQGDLFAGMETNA